MKTEAQPEAICVGCFAQFPISREEAEWIKEDGARVLCPTCWHAASGIDDSNDDC